MISVIILTKNEEKNIGKCLEYLYNQTYKDFEVIVVDANSTDRTVEIAKSYGAKVIKEKKKGGFGYARNLGVKHAKGDLIVFLDADVFLIDTETLKKSYESLVNYKVDGVWGKLLFPNTPLGTYLSRPYEVPLTITQNWGYRPPRTTSYLMLKKDVFDDVGYFDETFDIGCEDQEFFYRLYKYRKKLLYNPDIKIFHNIPRSIEIHEKKAYRDGIGLQKLYIKYNVGDENFSSALYHIKALIASTYACLDCIRRMGIKGLPVFVYNYRLMMARRRGFLDGYSLR
ncbi:glycosyltransferase [Candidatus Aerophobetes bacterium]|nr:glycosyltransferase [Candidatus Aerophobetes bacterium]